MKIALTGKGGVGKTTLAAVLCRLYAAEGKKVIAVDADPDANLGSALGFSPEEMAGITPISQMQELIAERTGTDKENFGKLFKLNPKVDDIPDRFSHEKHGVKLLLMGSVETGGGGCICPESVMLKQLMTHLVIGRDEVVVMDMEAGLEHLGRGTASMMGNFIVVIEPGERSVQTLGKVKQLAKDLGIKKLGVAANKLRSTDDEDFVKSRIPADELLGLIHYSEETALADRKGISPFDNGGSVIEDIRKIKEKLDN